MNTRPLMRRTVSVLVVAAMVGPLWAGKPSAVLSGRILAADGFSPVAGAVVKLSGQAGKTLSSPPTRSDGSFSMSELSSGTYEVIVDTDEGLYKVTSPLSLDTGKAHTVRLALRKDAEAGGLDEDGEAQQGAAGGGGGGVSDTTVKVLIGVALVLGATALVVALDDEEPASTTIIFASPSGPSGGN